MNWLTLAVNSQDRPSPPKRFPRPGGLEHDDPVQAVSLASFANLMEE